MPVHGGSLGITFGTELAEGTETRRIDGRSYVLEYPLRADYALISALRGDRCSNIVYGRTARHFGQIMALAEGPAYGRLPGWRMSRRRSSGLGCEVPLVIEWVTSTRRKPPAESIPDAPATAFRMGSGQSA